MITLSTNMFTANEVNRIVATVPAGYNTSILYSDDSSKIKLSLDGDTFGSQVTLSNGDNDVYVNVGDISGEFSDVLGYFYLNQGDSNEGYYTVTVTGGAVPLFERMSLSFSPRAATMQFSGEAVNSSFNLNSKNSGRLLDFPFNYTVESVAEQGARQIVSGASFSTELVHKLIIYTVTYEFHLSILGWTRPSIQDHLSAVSSEIGIPIVYRGRTFYPKTDMNFMIRKHLTSLTERISGSFGEIMNRLFGWSDSVPGMTYHLYISNGTIYIIQQGYEQNTVTIPDAWALRPTLSHSIRRTEWADSQSQTVIPKEISSSDAANSGEPFSGTLTWGSTSLTYEDGYLTQEVKGNVTTDYVYTDLADGKRLASKTITETEPDTQEVVSETVTTYDYHESGKDSYLFEENTIITEDGEIVSKQLTRHVPIGGGWYGTTVYDTLDGTEEVVSDSLSQGAPGQAVSQYLVDSANDALKPAGAPRQMTVPLTGVARVRQSYPVADRDTLQAIATALDTYEGKEQITLTGEIVGGTHVYTYNDKIVYNGQQYFLVSNNVTFLVSNNVTQIRQNITAVRWIQ